MDKVFNVQTSIEDGAPEVEIRVDRMRAGMYNIDINTVVTQIQDQLEGKNAGQLERDGEMRDISIKVPEKSLNEVNEIMITSGEQIFRLSEIAEITRCFAKGNFQAQSKPHWKSNCTNRQKCCTR
jgi:hydrophobic/amphiphilic exporter-1 (mainly G- bacteria), HAE1 family